MAQLQAAFLVLMKAVTCVHIIESVIPLEVYYAFVHS